MDVKIKTEGGEHGGRASDEEGGGGAEPLPLAVAITQEMDRLMADNKRLQNLVTEMHRHHHEITVKVRCDVCICWVRWAWAVFLNFFRCVEFVGNITNQLFINCYCTIANYCCILICYCTLVNCTV